MPMAINTKINYLWRCQRKNPCSPNIMASYVDLRAMNKVILYGDPWSTEYIHTQQAWAIAIA